MRIAVIGLGLIGGSILKGLKDSDYELIGMSKRQESIDNAVNQGIISHGSTDMDIIKDADVVFVCTPINKTLETIQKASQLVKPGAIITDVASIKGFIMDYANEVPINFIGGHPMAGTEHKGLDASFGTLFNEAKWVLTPSIHAKIKSLNILEEIISKLGATPVIANPHQHDTAVALISHMPLFISQVLKSFVQNYPDRETGELALTLAASGFRSMTRLADTNPELAYDMLKGNKKNVSAVLDEFINMLNEKRGGLYVISGPSGVGKGTLVGMLTQNNPELELSISTTTRKPRPGEIEGVHYFFENKDVFLEKANNGGFLEWAEFAGNCYGTDRTFVEKKLRQGRKIILEIDVKGALQVKKLIDNATLIFIQPPSLETLKQRLFKRKTESEEQMSQRLAIVQSELGQVDRFDYSIVNDDLYTAYEELEEIILK